MKTLIFLLIVLLPLMSNGQAHLGSTLSDIKAMHPEKKFNVNYSNDGTRYATALMHLGTFVYYFDKDSGISRLCLQIPYDLKSVNTQIEIYNTKYVIESVISWKAYLEGGGIMKIKLTYDEEHKTYLFTYTQMESSPQPTESQTKFKFT